MADMEKMRYVYEGDDRQLQATAQRVDRTFKNLGGVGNAVVAGLSQKFPVLGGLLDAVSNKTTTYAGSATTAAAATSELAGGMAAAAGPVAAAGAAMLATAAAGVSVAKGLFDAANAASEYGSRINDLNIETGLSAETLSALSTQAELSGTSLETVNVAFEHFSRLVGEASRGSDEAREKLNRFGIDVPKAAQSSESAMREMLRALNDVQSDAERIDLARTLGGRGGARLITLSRDINGNLDETISRLRQMGVVIDRETMEKADKFGDALSLMTTQAKILGYQLGFELQPTFTSAMNSMSQSMAANQNVIAGGFKLIAWNVAGVIEQVKALAYLPVPAALLDVLGRMGGGGIPDMGGDLGGSAGIFRKKPKPAWDGAPIGGGGRGGGGGGGRRQSVDDRGREWAARLEQQFLSLGATTEVERVNVELLSKEWAKLDPIIASTIRTTAQSITNKQKNIDKLKEEKDALDKLPQSWRRVVDSQEADLASLRGLDGPYEKLLKFFRESEATAKKYGKSLDDVIKPVDQLAERLRALYIGSEETSKKIEDLFVPDRVIESMQKLAEALPQPQSIADAMREWEKDPKNGPPPAMDDGRLRDRLKQISGQFRSGIEGTISDSLVDLMEGRGAEAGRNFVLGFAHSVEQGLADALADRLTNILFDKTGLGKLFDKIAGGVLGVEVDPAELAAQAANTRAVDVNSLRTDFNTQALDRLTAAMERAQAASAAGGGGGGLMSSLISAGLGVALNAIMPGLGALGSLFGDLFGGLFSGDHFGRVGEVIAGPMTPISRATGGPGMAGTLYQVNDNPSGREFFRPDVNGQFIPLESAPLHSYSSSYNSNHNYSSSSDRVHHTGSVEVRVREDPPRAPNSYYPRRSDREIGDAILKLIAPALR